MKKKALLLGSLLLAVVVTAFSVSGTYAKYVSTIDKTDEARVAKWGIGKETMVDLFKDTYYVAGDTTNTKYYVKATADSNGDTENLVAPGTEGAYAFEITFAKDGDDAIAPEVNYKINLEVLTAKDTINGYITDYNPIVYTLDGTEVGTIDDLKTALLALYDGTVYAAGTIPTAANLKHTIGWKWALEQTVDTSTIAGYDAMDTDAKAAAEAAELAKLNANDTKLGNDIFTEDLSVELVIKVTIEQTNAEASSY